MGGTGPAVRCCCSRSSPALGWPALRRLRAAVGVRLEVPEYAEGLIALYEGKNEEAIEKARTAFTKAPWMYEPKKLEGDALYAEGSKYRHDAAFDYEKMKGYFDRAAQAYRVAAEMGVDRVRLEPPSAAAAPPGAGIGPQATSPSSRTRSSER